MVTRFFQKFDISHFAFRHRPSSKRNFLKSKRTTISCQNNVQIINNYLIQIIFNPQLRKRPKHNHLLKVRHHLNTLLQGEQKTLQLSIPFHEYILPLITTLQEPKLSVLSKSLNHISQREGEFMSSIELEQFLCTTCV